MSTFRTSYKKCKAALDVNARLLCQLLLMVNRYMTSSVCGFKTSS